MAADVAGLQPVESVTEWSPPSVAKVPRSPKQVVDTHRIGIELLTMRIELLMRIECASSC